MPPARSNRTNRNRGGGSRPSQAARSGSRPNRPGPSRSAAPRPTPVETIPPPSTSADKWDDARRSNQRRALALTFLPAVLVAAVFIALGFVGHLLVVAIAIAVLALVAGGVAYVVAPRALLGRLGAVTADHLEEARLYNILEGLCLAWGLPQPELRLLADDAPNAISLGRGPDDAVVVCTTGLIASLDRIELEAVLGHELAHVRSLDILSGTVAAGTLGYLALISASARRGLIRRSGAGRESLADQASTTLTRYPPAMISALEKLAAAPSCRPASLTSSVAIRSGHMWLVPLDPDGSAVDSGVAAGDVKPVIGALTLEERIALLREL